MISVVAPGQGSQSPGFLGPWLELSAFRESLESFAGISGLDLARLGTVADADEIRDTAIAQPLIVASAIASFEMIREKLQGHVVGFAGHSVGEIAACYASGIFSLEQAASFVTLRGSQMALAAAEVETSMAAVVGGDLATVLEKLNGLGLLPANYNGPGQLVAAGEKSKISQLVDDPPSGSRVIELQVAGAFHTHFMKNAQSALSELAKSLTVQDPADKIWTNSDGSLVASGAEYLELLVNQVVNPVRWDKTMTGMLSEGVRVLIELVPGGTLSGIAKRAMPGVTTLALKSPSDLEKLEDLLKTEQ